MSLPPSEIPLGAMRFNSDSRKLEYWMGSAWMQIHTFSPNIGGISGQSGSIDGTGTRALFAGGKSPSTDNVIQFVEIATTGNAQDFGDLTSASSFGSTGGTLSNGHGGL